MKKLSLLFLLLTSICMMSCKNASDSSDPEIPSAKLLIEKVPTSIEEYETLQNESRTARTGSALPASATADINAGTTIQTDLGYHMIFLAILKNDIKNVEGLELNKNIRVPEGFEISDYTVNQLNTKGIQVQKSYFPDLGTIKVTYDNDSKESKIYWKLSIVSGDGGTSDCSLLIKGTFTNNRYDNLDLLMNYDFGLATKTVERYTMDGNSYILSSRGFRADQTQIKKVFIRENGIEKTYQLGNIPNVNESSENLDELNAYRWVYLKNNNAIGYADNKENYMITDRNSNLIITIYHGTSNYIQRIPLKFISTSPAITSDGTYYYIGDTQLTKIVSQTFEGSSPEYLFYQTENNTSAKTFDLEDGVIFTAKEFVEQTIDTFNQMLTQCDQSVVTSKIIPDSTITQLENEYNTWINSL